MVDADPVVQLSDAELTRAIEDLCHSKAQEFHLLGYGRIQSEEIWNCISEKYGQDLPSIHRMVNDILSLKITSFMNWATKRSFLNADSEASAIFKELGRQTSSSV